MPFWMFVSSPIRDELKTNQASLLITFEIFQLHEHLQKWQIHHWRLYMEALGLWRLSYVFNIDVGIIYSQLKAYCSQRTLEYTDGGNPIKEKTWQHLISVHACLIQHPDRKKETERKTIGASRNVLSWPASELKPIGKVGWMWFFSKLQVIPTCLWDKMWAKQWKNVLESITAA